MIFKDFMQLIWMICDLDRSKVIWVKGLQDFKHMQVSQHCHEISLLMKVLRYSAKDYIPGVQCNQDILQQVILYISYGDGVGDGL